ncbi:MAG: hypothetical protein MKZ70_09070, partial [Opitutales bacterium]|nr:hypothetical protein [Opitutales bacterium]
MKSLGLISVVITGWLLLSAVGDFPDWGDPNSPANSYRLSQHFVTETFHETAVPNMVTAVLADYRGYDTMFESVVIFTAGIAIISILRRFTSDGADAGTEKVYEKRPALIVDTTCRLMLPIIQLVAVSVIAHGPHSPG